MPAFQSMMTSQIPANARGELQGALSGVNSITAILGPLLMTQLFAMFTAVNTSVCIPGGFVRCGGSFECFKSADLCLRRTAGGSCQCAGIAENRKVHEAYLRLFERRSEFRSEACEPWVYGLTLLYVNGYIDAP